MDHDANVIGAAFLLVADRMQGAIEASTGRRGAQIAALTALHGWADGHSIDSLARGVDVSHSRAVRIVDALVATGLATRTPDATDRRRATVALTARGTAAAIEVLEARSAVLDDILRSMPPTERTALARASASVLLHSIDSRDAARLACRLCDVDACGHHDGRCPSTRAADERPVP
jgi:DNA-binding MarR family transcriptional regulator